MTEIFEVRCKPELKISLNNDGIEIVDGYEPKNNGVYSFEQIKSVELNAERTNWFISILSWIVDLLAGSAVGGNFKNKASLNIKLADQDLKILLINAAIKKVERISESLHIKRVLKP